MHHHTHMHKVTCCTYLPNLVMLLRQIAHKTHRNTLSCHCSTDSLTAHLKTIKPAFLCVFLCLFVCTLCENAAWLHVVCAVRFGPAEMRWRDSTSMTPQSFCQPISPKKKKQNHPLCTKVILHTAASTATGLNHTLHTQRVSLGSSKAEIWNAKFCLKWDHVWIWGWILFHMDSP